MRTYTRSHAHKLIHILTWIYTLCAHAHAHAQHTIYLSDAINYWFSSHPYKICTRCKSTIKCTPNKFKSLYNLFSSRDCVCEYALARAFTQLLVLADFVIWNLRFAPSFCFPSPPLWHYIFFPVLLYLSHILFEICPPVSQPALSLSLSLFAVPTRILQ